MHQRAILGCLFIALVLGSNLVGAVGLSKPGEILGPLGRTYRKFDRNDPSTYKTWGNACDIVKSYGYVCKAVLKPLTKCSNAKRIQLLQTMDGR